jgi:hypothetical protein
MIFVEGTHSGWGRRRVGAASSELPFMGWRFTAVRCGLGLIFPILAGGIAQLIFG